MVKPSAIRRLEDEIRSYISAPPTQTRLMADLRGAWDATCASLDVLGDSEEAIDAYLDTDVTSDYGRAYLLTYGLLQALYLQQDAVAQIAVAISLPYRRSDALKEVREFRNDAAGHPTRRKNDTFCFIVRSSIDEHGFTYHKSDVNGRFEACDVNLPELVSRHRAEVIKDLTTIAQRLKDDRLAFVKKHAAIKLARLIPDVYAHYLQSVSRAMTGGGAFGVMHVDLLLEPVLQIETLLADREDSVEGPELSLVQVKHMLQRLRGFFGGQEGISREDAHVFVSFLYVQFKHLRETVARIDAEYEDEAAGE